MNTTNFEEASRILKKVGGLVTKNQLITVENTLVSKKYRKTLLNDLKGLICNNINNVINNDLSYYIE